MENREFEDFLVFFLPLWVVKSGSWAVRGREREGEGGRAEGVWKGGRWEGSAGKGGFFWSGKVVMEGVMWGGGRGVF